MDCKKGKKSYKQGVSMTKKKLKLKSQLAWIHLAKFTPEVTWLCKFLVLQTSFKDLSYNLTDSSVVGEDSLSIVH